MILSRVWEWSGSETNTRLRTSLAYLLLTGINAFDTRKAIKPSVPGSISRLNLSGNTISREWHVCKLETTATDFGKPKNRKYNLKRLLSGSHLGIKHGILGREKIKNNEKRLTMLRSNTYKCHSLVNELTSGAT